MREWRNWQTRWIQVPVSQDVRVQVSPSAPYSLIRIKIISNFLVGISPSGKAPGFDPGIPRFKSWYPSQFAHVFDYTSRFILNSNYIIYIFNFFYLYNLHHFFLGIKKDPNLSLLITISILTKLTAYCVFQHPVFYRPCIIS